MTYRGGDGMKKASARLVGMVVVVMLTIAVKGNPLPPSEEDGDCLVEDHIDVAGQDLPVSLLAYVSRSISVDIGFFFPTLDRVKDRDAVIINSTGATHTEVWDGKGSFTDISLPRLIPEGWNTFLVDANGKSVTVTLLLGEDRLTLFTLPSLRSEVDSIQARGKVARCSTVTPTWKVNPGDRAVVLLQPTEDSTRNQWLEVEGRGWDACTPQLVITFTPSSKVNVSENSTFRFTSSVRGEYVHFWVFKEAKSGGGGDGDEEVTSGNVTVDTPSLRVEVSGGCGGDNDPITTTLFRLQLSPPHTKSMDKSVSTSPDYHIPFSVVLVVLVLVVVVALVLLVRNDARKGNGVLASCLKCCKTKGGGDSTGRTEAEGQEGNSSLHMNGAFRGVGSEEGINGHDPLSSQSLLLSANGTPTQRDPRSLPSTLGA